MTTDQERIEKAKRSVLGELKEFTKVEMPEKIPPIVALGDPTARKNLLAQYIDTYVLAETMVDLAAGWNILDLQALWLSFLSEFPDHIKSMVRNRPERKDRCPRCGSTNIIGYGTHEVSCADCGHVLGVDD